MVKNESFRAKWLVKCIHALEEKDIFHVSTFKGKRSSNLLTSTQFVSVVTRKGANKKNKRKNPKTIAVSEAECSPLPW